MAHRTGSRKDGRALYVALDAVVTPDSDGSRRALGVFRKADDLVQWQWAKMPSTFSKALSLRNAVSRESSWRTNGLPFLVKPMLIHRLIRRTSRTRPNLLISYRGSYRLSS